MPAVGQAPPAAPLACRPVPAHSAQRVQLQKSGWRPWVANSFLASPADIKTTDWSEEVAPFCAVHSRAHSPGSYTHSFFIVRTRQDGGLMEQAVPFFCYVHSHAHPPGLLLTVRRHQDDGLERGGGALLGRGHQNRVHHRRHHGAAQGGVDHHQGRPGAFQLVVCLIAFWLDRGVTERCITGLLKAGRTTIKGALVSLLVPRCTV